MIKLIYIHTVEQEAISSYINPYFYIFVNLFIELDETRSLLWDDTDVIYAIKTSHGDVLCSLAKIF